MHENRGKKEICLIEWTFGVFDTLVPIGLNWDTVKYDHKRANRDPNAHSNEKTDDRISNRGMLEYAPVETQDRKLANSD